MKEIEKMYRLANAAKPVIKKWYYDGYYEDFSWQSSEEDCTELLKYFDNSIDKLNDRIQQMKKEENTKYDRSTDSVDTEFGRIEKAYIVYPSFTAEKQLNLMAFLINRKVGLSFKAEQGEITVEAISRGLAGIVNRIWQDLTEEEKQQVKGILE